MKKIVSMLLTFSFIVGVFPLFNVVSYANEYSTEIPFDEYIIAHLENFESEINVTDYAIKNKWDENYIANEFARIITDNPQLFFIINSGQVCKVTKSTVSSKGVVISATYKITSFKYAIKKSDYEGKKKSFLAAADKALTAVGDDFTDWEKALYIHDYLALNVKYDNSLSKFTAYDALVGKSSVCQGYAMAYVYLMRELGIECTMITSESMNHAWNYIKIDGKWYHVDITSDDPRYNGKYDMLGRVNHSYFLVSDNALKKLGSKGWITGGLPAASSTKYDNYFWKDVSTGIYKLDDSWYWIELDKTSPGYNNNYEKLSKEERNESFYKMYSLIRRYNVKTNKSSTVYKFYSTWFTWGTENKTEKAWSDNVFSNLASYNGLLYFNTSKILYSFDTATKKASKVSAPANLDGYIYGITMDGNKITYTVKQKADQADTLKTKTVS